MRKVILAVAWRPRLRRRAALSFLGCAVALLLVAGRMYQSSDARLIDVSKDAMRASLFDPASATFEGLRVVKHDQDRIVCGLVNAKNRLGGYVARRPFLYNGYAAVIYDDDDWRRYGAEMLACDPTLEERRREFERRRARPPQDQQKAREEQEEEEARKER